jgi:hypothetical protein
MLLKDVNLVIIHFMKMKTLTLTLSVLVLIFAACKKDKFTTEPQIKFKSISPSEAIKGNIISFTSSFTDEEGDIQDSIIYVIKRFATIPTIDTFKLKLNPEGIPDGRQGDISIRFSYGEFSQDNTATFLNLETVDTQVSFGLLITDRAGHRSNYVESDKITLKKL